MNITDDWVPLFDLMNPENTWRLGVGTYYVFPPDIVIPPRSLFLVVSEEPETFRVRHNVPDDVPIFGPISYFPYALDYGLYLERPSGTVTEPDGGVWLRLIPVEALNFAREYPWPAEANASGSSLQRLQPHEFGNDPNNWRASAAMSPGRPNFTRPIDGWRAWHFNRSEIADPTISGDAADPDGDMLNNVVEYAFGLDPNVPSKLPIRVEMRDGRLSATLQKSAAAPEVEIFGESAGSLHGPWSADNVETEVGSPEITLRDRVQSSSSRFLRIHVRLGD